ncbi:MAG: class I SAM-dependent methyltransferase [Gammaproteobacteria bacterium]|nr:class I SAM-dependent methyltransferase [Gammaproteobacteria bacterium]
MVSSEYEKAWFESALGERFLQAETAVVDDLLLSVFGFFLVQVGEWGGGDMLRSCRVREKLVVSHHDCASKAVSCDPHHLPFASDSLDVLVLPHTLEFVESPHQVLREAERVLVGEGHLLILGFSPWSAWGLRAALSRKRFPWHGRYLSEPRLRDWLNLLDFEVIQSRRYFYRPPLSHAGILEKLKVMDGFCDRWFSYLANAYAIVARKRMIALTPLKFGWRSKKKILGGLVKPATRSIH